MILRYKWPILSVSIILVFLVFTSQRTSPIPTGHAEDYWEFACGVELEKFDGYFPYAHWTGIFPEMDEWHFYYFQEHHGRHVFKIRQESLVKETDELFNLLDLKITSSVQEKGLSFNLDAKNERRVKCKKLMVAVASNPEKFVERVSSMAALNSDRQNELDGFQNQWELAKRYWMSILFEALFISFWWLFTFHPKVWGRYKISLTKRLAWSPLTLLIPHYLGYAPYMFSFGPSGGIIYPIFAMLISLPFSWIPFNPIEVELLNYLPQPLFFISQEPYSPMAMSFTGSVSPTALCIYACFVLTTSKIVCKYRVEQAKKASKMNEQ